MKISYKSGFTLVEVMVVISVIAILSAIMYANFGTAKSSSRDAQRQSQLQIMKTAIEQYKQKNGRYPAAGCTGAALTWASESCSGGNYVANLAPEFITTLPRDPNRRSNPGYSYMTNTAGTVFKLMAMNTVEKEIVTATHKFRSCDIGTAVNLCNMTTTYTQCAPTAARFQTSYAVWGGYDSTNALSAQILCS